MLFLLRLVLILGLGIALPILILGEDGLEMTGTVVDRAGAAVGGAEVRLLDADGSERAAATTEIDGVFRFAGLAPGTYRLSVQAPDLEPVTRAVTVRAGMRPVRITLDLEVLAQSVVVEAESSPPVDLAPESNQTSITLDTEMLWDLPSLGNDPLAAASEWLDEGETGEGGTLVVDGMEADRLDVSASAIAEVRINRNPYSAEYSRPGRGRIEVITRQATHEYHGSLGADLRDARMDARNAFAEVRPDQRRREVEGHLTGPLSRDGKRSFLLSGEWEDDQRQNVVYALLPQGVHQANVDNPQRDGELTGRMTHRGDRHQLSVQGRWQRETAAGLNVGGLSLPETAVSAEQSGRQVRFAHTWLASPTFLAQLQGRLSWRSDWQRSDTPGVPRVEVDGAFDAGSAQVDSSRNRLGRDATYTATWSRRKHFVRAGAVLADWDSYSYLNRDNFGGTWRFASLADFEAARPFAFAQRAGLDRLDVTQLRLGLFVQDDWRVADQVTVGLGVRYEWDRFLANRNNVAPRVSLAWSPDQQRKTVIRTGAGLFYSRMPISAVTDRRWLADGLVEERLTLEPAFDPGGPLPGNAEEVPTGRVAWDQALRMPYLAHFSLGVERALPGGLAASLEYSAYRGISVLRARDLNPPLPPFWQRPDPALAWARQIESSGRSQTDRFQIGVKGKAGRYFDGLARYTLGWARSDAENFGRLPPDSLDLADQWGWADFDRRHRLEALGRTRLWAGWTLGTILRIRGGRPYELLSGEDRNQDGFAVERPPGVARNALRLPATSRVDVRLSRQFKLRPQADSRAAVAVSLDAFNLLNRVNVSRMVGNLRSPLFGQAGGRGIRPASAGLRPLFVLKAAPMTRRLLLSLLAAASADAADEDARNKEKTIGRLAGRWKRLVNRRNRGREGEFFQGAIPALFRLAEESEAGSYRLGRYLKALDELLDAVEEFDAAFTERPTEKDSRRRTARHLERTYFRVQQAEYFARQVKDAPGDEYVITARRLYQQARAAYDAEEFAKARRLADAAREVTGALEALAQAAVPVPQPPPL